MKNILLLVGLILSVAIVVLAGNRIYSLFAKATGSSDPQNVAITEITSSSATITFSTSQSLTSIIEYGVNPTNLPLSASDTDTTNHVINLTLLTPNTTYYFHIKMNGNTYDNAGVPWTFTTSGTNVPLVTKAVPTIFPTAVTAGKASCSDVAKHMGAVRGGANYEAKDDLNGDGIINSADMSLCGK